MLLQSAMDHLTKQAKLAVLWVPSAYLTMGFVLCALTLRPAAHSPAYRSHHHLPGVHAGQTSARPPNRVSLGVDQSR